MIDIVCCVWDSGFFTPLAETLGKYYSKVYYYTPRESGYMKCNDDRVGEGIKGVEKIYSVWDKIDEIDLFVFPDCFWAAEQEYLKKLGKLVWGSGKTSWMEQDRFALREWQEKEGMPTPKWEECVGIDDLKESLKENQFVKINKYRSDMETLRHYDKTRSEQRFDELKVKLGAYKDLIPFMVENKVDGIEIGIDTWNIDGQFPNMVLVGIEEKDCGYFGKYYQRDELPEAIKYVNEKMVKVFTEENYKGFYSNEIKVNGKKYYLLDQTMRAPNPPYQLHLEMLSNLGEIIYYGAQGKIIVPKLKAKYGAVAVINSDFAVKNWISLDIPEDARQWVKIMNMCVINDEIYSVPLYGLSEIGAVIGIGNTPEEAIENCKKHADQIKGDSVEIDVDAVEDACEELREHGFQE